MQKIKIMNNTEEIFRTLSKEELIKIAEELNEQFIPIDSLCRNVASQIYNVKLLDVTLIMCVGLSGSGKDFYLNNKFLKDFPIIKKLIDDKGISLNDLIVARDNIRRDITGDVSNHDNEVQVNLIEAEKINNIIKKYNYVICNGINLCKRNATLKYAPGAYRIAIIFEANPKLSKERIKKDLDDKIDRSDVPAESIDKQFIKFKRCLVGLENWDGVWNDDTKNRIRKYLKKEFDEIIFINN